MLFANNSFKVWLEANWTSQIHQEIIDELENAIENLRDEEDPQEIQLLDQGLQKIISGQPLLPAEKQAIQSELFNIESKDLITGNKRMYRKMLETLAKLGMLTPYNPAATYTRKPRTQMIDGVLYEV